MRALLVALILMFAGAAAAQYPTQCDGTGNLPTSTVPGSTGGLHLWRNCVESGAVASRVDAVVTSAYTNATTTPSTILSITLNAAYYHCHARLTGTDSTAGDGVSIVLNTSGITAGANSTSSGYIATTAPAFTPVVVVATGGSHTIAVATFATGYVDIEAVLQVTAGGAVTVTGAQNAHTAGTLTINKGSFINCEAL